MKRIVVQAGHNAPREPGFESGTGTTGEIAFTKSVSDELIRLLREDGRFLPIYQPGDILDGIKCDLALFLHADGSANKAASGYSFGYDARYSVNRKLADLIALEFDRLPGHPPHHSDNYTAGLRQYYGFSRVNCPGGEVLVEHGFLTNPREAAWMRANVKNLARAEYLAILAYFSYPVIVDDPRKWQPGEPIWSNLPGPSPKPPWFWDALEEISRRRKILDKEV
jgi:N-acetylmuramoyl-L-alanine amidase